MTQRILVTGATGRTGQLLINSLLQHPQKPIIRVLVRSQAQADVMARRGLETALGDVMDSATSWADAALRDVDVVMSTMGGTPFRSNNLWRVDYEGTQRLVTAAKTANIEHYIFVSTMGLRRKRSLLHPLSILFYPKLLAEDVIRQSGLRYTILRPGGLAETASDGTRNTRQQVADACIAAWERGANNKTWEMAIARRAEPGADLMFGVSVEA